MIGIRLIYTRIVYDAVYGVVYGAVYRLYKNSYIRIRLVYVSHNGSYTSLFLLAGYGDGDRQMARMVNVWDIEVALTLLHSTGKKFRTATFR